MIFIVYTAYFSLLVLAGEQCFCVGCFSGSREGDRWFCRLSQRFSRGPGVLKWRCVHEYAGTQRPFAGGERSHRAAQRHELRCVQAYSDLDGDLQNLHTIPTALAYYRGVRLSAQGLAPGIQGPEQAEVPNGLLYGYCAGLLENPSRRKLLELLAQSAKALSLQRHAVLGPNGHQLPLFTSVDAQGILGPMVGNYLLDVYRTMPADANFHVEDGEGAETEEGNFPRRYPHVLCRLRPELVKAFIQHK